MNIKLMFLLVALVAVVAGFKLQQKGQSAKIAEPATEQLSFSFPDIKGQQQAIQQWQGKILIINFWATWCGPCLKEIPEFIQWQQAYQDKNVQFVGIAVDDQQSVVDYLKTIHINYPILIAGDAGSLLSHQLGNLINAVPFTVIVNAQGQIVHRQFGELSKEKFTEVLEPLLKPQVATE